MKFVLYLPQAPVVQKVDNAIHQINHYSLDSTIGFRKTLLSTFVKRRPFVPALPCTFQPSQDFQFVEYSRGLYVKERLLNNKIKGVNHEISKNNAAIVRVTNFKNVCVKSSACCLFKWLAKVALARVFNYAVARIAKSQAFTGPK